MSPDPSERPDDPVDPLHEDAASPPLDDEVVEGGEGASAPLLEHDVTLSEDGADEVEASPGVEESEAVAESDPADDELTLATIALEERTLDLQRLQAEFVNYKRRVDRDRELIRENATYTALTPIIEVLDNIDRAREHAPLDDGFRAVAEQLERVVAAQGLVKFGAVGDAFDPTIHEALSHVGEDPDVEVTTCQVIAKSGYKIGERVVRAAQVLVVEPAT